MSDTADPEHNPFGVAKGQVVLEEQTDDYHLQLVVAEDEMSASASLLPKQAKEDLLTVPQLLKLLSDNDITDGIDLQRVEEFCQKACSGKDQRQVVIAATEPPRPGADAWIEMQIRTASQKDIHLEENEEGRIDLYTLNMFTCVEPGQEIAILHPPEQGEASSTVTGKVLPPIEGKELDLRLDGGVRRDGDRFISEIAGRADLSENVLSVSEDYIVHGDVDLEVGNINFPGFTKIRGDVLDSFDIRSLKGIDVGGAVGACHLISDGDITIGSMSGQDDGLIRCGGNLTANYLNSVYVECMGTVTIRNEIRNCIIKSADKIIIKNGQISGGECIALRGIEAGDVGATAGVTTRLCSGVYFPESDRLSTLKAQQKSLTIQNQFINNCLGPLKKQAATDGSTTGATKKRLKILLERLELLQMLQEEVKKELNNFVFEDHPGNAKINIQRRLKEKVVISLETVTEEIRLERYGPLSVIADKINGTLHFSDLSPLEINADEMVIEEEAHND